MATSTGKKVRKTHFRAAEGARRRGSAVLESWRQGGGAKMKGREGDGEEHCSKSWEGNCSELSSRAQGGAVGSVMEGE